MLLGLLLQDLFAEDQCLIIKDSSYPSVAEGLRRLITTLRSGGWEPRIQKIKSLADRQGSDSQLAQVLTRVLASEPKNLLADQLDQNLESLRQAYQEGRFSDAQCLLEKALLNYGHMEEEFSSFNEMKGHLHRRNNQLDEAMIAYEACLRYEPKNTGALIGLGHVALAGQSFDDSIVFFRRAMSLEPESFEATHGMAMVASQIGLKAEALFWIEKSFLVAPDNKTVRSALIRMSLDCPASDLAIDMLERVLNESSPRDAKIVQALAQLYYKNGQVEKSQHLMKEIGEAA